LKQVLEDTGLVGFPKTSGQEGLHVLVPLGPGVPFTAAKLLVELLGRLVVSSHETFATMERRVDKRGGRLYVDTGQTGTSRTIVAPYSVRANSTAGVSTPLFWDELSGALDVQRFNLMTVPARVQELGDPWTPFLEATPDIATALRNLEKWLK
jgi:bifunctional non-homologous end joining protein LigD